MKGDLLTFNINYHLRYMLDLQPFAKSVPLLVQEFVLIVDHAQTLLVVACRRPLVAADSDDDGVADDIAFAVDIHIVVVLIAAVAAGNDNESDNRYDNYEYWDAAVGTASDTAGVGAALADGYSVDEIHTAVV